MTSREPTGSGPADDWNAGELSCGELLLALKLRLKALPPGAVLRVIARDPGAKEDLPSWCNLTGHRLVSAAPPTYVIRKRED